MRISDWSSDVCSSDLNARIAHPRESHRLALMLGRIPAAGERQRDRKARACKAEDDAQRERPGEAAHARKSRDEQTHDDDRSEEHTSELQSLMRISYAVFCLKKKKKKITTREQH